MNAPVIYNEPELLERFYNGSHDAFTQLYNKYAEPLYYNILSMVKDEVAAEELVQEIFADVWHKRSTINIETNFGNYIFAASRNRVYNFFKKTGSEQKLFEKLRAIATENYSHVEEALLAKENRALLENAIASLSPQRRRAFQLCKLDGLSYQQASIEMGISLATLKDHMAHARSDIREYVSTHGELALWILLFYCLN